MFDCANVEMRELLPDFVAGAVDAPTRARVEEHIGVRGHAGDRHSARRGGSAQARRGDSRCRRSRTCQTLDGLENCCCPNDDFRRRAFARDREAVVDESSRGTR